MDAWQPGRLHLAQARCAGCGLVAAQPQATEEELGAYYAGAYYEQHPLDAETHWKENCRDYPLYELPLMERLWAGFAPPRGGSVAEIGCGHGSLVTVMGARGYRARGVELSPSAVAFCRSKGLDVIEGKDFGPERAVCDVADQQHGIACGEHGSKLRQSHGFDHEAQHVLVSDRDLIVRDAGVAQLVVDLAHADASDRLQPLWPARQLRDQGTQR